MRPSEEENRAEYLREHVQVSEELQLMKILVTGLEYSSRRDLLLPLASSSRKSTQETSPQKHAGSSNRTQDRPSIVSGPGPSTSHYARSPGGQSGSARRRHKVPRKSVFKEIRKLQMTTNHLIPRLPFSRLIREILQIYAFENMRITPTALQALQESAELYLTTLFADAYRCTLHRGRVTLLIKDMELVRYLRGRDDPGNL